MGVVLDLMKDEIETTIKRLDSKSFDPDPIAGPHFSKITSVMSSAYKRHGYILERAILETLKLCPHFEVWRDIDAIVFNKNTGTLGAYEIKRGSGLHDSGKRRSM